MQRCLTGSRDYLSPPCHHRRSGGAGTGALLLLLLLGLSHSAPAASYTWTGAAGVWNDPFSWQPTGVPLPGDDVNLGDNAVVFLPGPPRTTYTLATLGNVTIGTHTTFFTDNALSVGNLTVGTNSAIGTSNGFMTVTGVLTTADLLRVSNLKLASGCQVAGTRTLGAGTGSSLSKTTLQIDGKVSLDTLNLAGAQLIGAGAVTITGTASAWGGATIKPSVTIASGGDLYLGGVDIVGNLTVNSGASLHAGSKYHDSYQVDGTITNSGTMDSRNHNSVVGKGSVINKAGGKFLAGSTAFALPFDNGAGATVQVSSFAATQDDSGAATFNDSFDNEGTIIVPAETINGSPTQANSLRFAGTINNHGIISVAGATVPTGPVPTVIFNGQALMFGGAELQGDGFYILSGMAHLSLGGHLIVRNLEIDSGGSNGALDGDGNLDITNKARWNGGTIGGGFTSYLNVTKTAILEIMGVTSVGSNGMKLEGRTLNNEGTIEWSGGGVELAGGLLINRGTLNVSSGNQPGFALIKEGASPSQFNNRGLIQVPLGSSLECNAVFNNSGTVTITGGRMEISGGGTCAACTFRLVGTNSKLALTNGTLNLNANCTITGTGLCSIDGATVAVNAPVSAQNCELVNGDLAGAGNFTVNGSNGHMVWSNGTMSGTGTTTIAPGATLSILGQGTKTLTRRSLNTNGLATWTGRGNLVVSGGGVVNNAGLFNLESAHTLGAGNNGASPVFVNRGRLVRLLDLASADGQGTTTLDGAVLNYGTVEVKSQTIALTHGYTQHGGSTGLYDTTVFTVTGGPVNILSGSNLFGGGRIIGHVVNSGSVTPGYSNTNKTTSLDIQGDYTQTATGVLNVDMVKGPVLDHDLLQVGGKAILAGNLNVIFLTQFDPRPATGSYARTAIGFQSHSGSFAELTGEKQFFTLQYINAAVNLVATAAGTNPKDRAAADVSTARASIVDGDPLLQLTFTRPLAPTTAADVASYQVTRTRAGSMVRLAIESVSYNATTRTATIALPHGTLRPGDTVTVWWRGLSAGSGLALAGHTAALAIP